MGRHAQTGKQSLSVAPWLIRALIAAVVVMTFLITWFAYKNAKAEAETCPEGSYTMTVWATPSAEKPAKDLAKRFTDTKPVAADHCVKAKVEKISDDEVIAKLKDASNDKAAANTLAGAWLPADSAKAIQAAQEAEISINTSVVALQDGKYAVLPISTNKADQITGQNAGAEFSNFALGEVGDGSQAQISDLSNGTANQTSAPKSASPSASGASTPEPVADAQALAQATFLLDTSGSMGFYEGDHTRMDNVRAALTQQIIDLGQAGTTVSLWNYSSPLGSTAKVPFRANVQLSEGDKGEQANAVLSQLKFGGATYTYQSVVAAYTAAVQAAQADGTATAEKPARVVLITDGPNDGGTLGLQDAIAQIQQLHGQAAVQLNVVTIGDRVDGDAMNQIAEAGGGYVQHANDSTVVADALRSASAVQ